MRNSDRATDPLEDITLVTEPSEAQLNERQFLDYRSERERCLSWLLTFGKDPETAEGYPKTTVESRAARMNQFYRWVWEYEDGYTSHLITTHVDAYLRHLAAVDAYLRHLAAVDASDAHENTCRKAVMMLYEWRHRQCGADP